MPAVQEQDAHLAGPHPLCGQAALPGTRLDEHRRPHVYQAVGHLSTMNVELGYGLWGGCERGKGSLLLKEICLWVDERFGAISHDGVLQLGVLVFVFFFVQTPR